MIRALKKVVEKEVAVNGIPNERRWLPSRSEPTSETNYKRIMGLKPVGIRPGLSEPVLSGFSDNLSGKRLRKS